MTLEERENQLVLALKLGVIDWFQYFKAYRALHGF